MTSANNSREDAAYMFENFDVVGFISSKYSHYDQNAVSRMCNTMVKAVQDQVILPKWVIIVFDDDLIKYISGRNPFAPTMTAVSKVIDNIMKEHIKVLQIQKEYLPRKSQRRGFPQLLWIEAPIHTSFDNNTDREKYNLCINDVAPLHENTYVLALKKIWDPDNLNLYHKDAWRFTAEGYKTYWSAVDKTIKYADTILLKKIQKKNEPKTGSFEQVFWKSFNDQYDQYHWRSDDYRHNKRRRLPTLPGHWPNTVFTLYQILKRFKTVNNSVLIFRLLTS